MSNLTLNFEPEGFPKSRVHLEKDVMYDAALFYVAKASHANSIMGRLDIRPLSFVLATIHRADNTDDLKCLKLIFHAFEKFKFRFVLPIHPRIKSRLEISNIALPTNVRPIAPVG